MDFTNDNSMALLFPSALENSLASIENGNFGLAFMIHLQEFRGTIILLGANYSKRSNSIQSRTTLVGVNQVRKPTNSSFPSHIQNHLKYNIMKDCDVSSNVIEGLVKKKLIIKNKIKVERLEIFLTLY